MGLGAVTVLTSVIDRRTPFPDLLLVLWWLVDRPLSLRLLGLGVWNFMDEYVEEEEEDDDDDDDDEPLTLPVLLRALFLRTRWLRETMPRVCSTQTISFG